MKRTAGISLMLLIFLSLCLITFSLLSLSGANADEKLSQNSADRTTEYYAAVTEANEILSEVDARLADAFLEAQGSEDPEQTYFEACAEITISGVDLEWTMNENSADENVIDSGSDSSDEAAENENAESIEEISYTLSYNVEMSDDQHLHMELSVTWPTSGSDTLYRVISQQVVSTQDWSADTSQNLYQGSAD